MITAIRLSRFLALGTVSVALIAGSPSHAHKATERYIPIGQSPGVSHTITVIGRIEAVDEKSRRIVVAVPSGSADVAIRDRTRIWLDRSKAMRTNLDGSFADLRTGRTVEVRFVDRERGRIADWIKVELPGSP